MICTNSKQKVSHSIKNPSLTHTHTHTHTLTHMNVQFYQVQLTSDIDVLLNELIPRLTERYRKTGRLTLLVFDDLISIADQLRVYSRFLATCRHYGVTTINIFKTYRGTHCWDGIKANCQTLVLFKMGLASPTVISQVCNVNIGSSGNAKTKRDNWLYRLFTENVLNRGDYNHLLIDMHAQTSFSPTRFRSQTANLYTQRCYFDRGNKTDYDTSYYSHSGKRPTRTPIPNECNHSHRVGKQCGSVRKQQAQWLNDSWK